MEVEENLNSSSDVSLSVSSEELRREAVGDVAVVLESRKKGNQREA